MAKLNFERDRLIAAQNYAENHKLSDMTLGAMLSNPQNGGRAAEAWEVVYIALGMPLEVKTGRDAVIEKLVGRFTDDGR